MKDFLGRETKSIEEQCHWTKFLDEVGTVYSHDGHYQEIAKKKIFRLEEELKVLKEKYEADDIKLTKVALKDWTQEEIDKAKALARFYNLSNEAFENLSEETKIALKKSYFFNNR